MVDEVNIRPTSMRPMEFKNLVFLLSNVIFNIFKLTRSILELILKFKSCFSFSKLLDYNLGLNCHNVVLKIRKNICTY